MGTSLRITVFVGIAVGLLVGGALMLLGAFPPGGDAVAQGAEVRERVQFLTNREAAARRTGPGEGYGGERGRVAYGRCTVRFSPITMAADLAERVELFVPTEFRDIAVAAGGVDHLAFRRWPATR